jgi:hypothetical protein
MFLEVSPATEGTTLSAGFLAVADANQPLGLELADQLSAGQAGRTYTLPASPDLALIQTVDRFQQEVALHRFDAARVVLDRYIQDWPAVNEAVVLREALAAQPLDEKQVADKAVALAREAQERIDALQRESRLRRVLDRRLWPVAFDPPATDAGPAEDPTILVSILVSEVSQESLAALSEAGLEILAKVERARHVVGRVSRDRLRAVADLAIVRRIEPVQPRSGPAEATPARGPGAPAP